MPRADVRRSPPPPESYMKGPPVFLAPPGECVAMYKSYKEQERRMDEASNSAHEWLLRSVDEAVARISANLPGTSEQSTSISSGLGCRSLRKRSCKAADDVSVPTTERIKRKIACIKLETVDEADVFENNPLFKQASASDSPVLSDSKSAAPEKPLRRRNAPRVASTIATKNITLNLLEEKQDPSKLRYTKSTNLNRSEAFTKPPSAENYRCAVTSTVAKGNGAVAKRVVEYEEKITATSPSKTGHLTPTLAKAVDDTDDEDDGDIARPLQVSKVVLTLSQQKLSPKVTCSPLNTKWLSGMRTSNGTYKLLGTALRRLSSRRPSASDRFKRRSELGSLSVVMDQLLSRSRRSSKSDVAGTSSEEAQLDSDHDAAKVDVVDAVASGSTVVDSNKIDNVISSTVRSAAVENETLRRTCTPSTYSRNPLVSKSQVGSIKRSFSGLRKHPRYDAVLRDSTKSSSAHRERSKVRSMLDVMERIDALKMKEVKTLEVLKKRDLNIKTKIENLKKKREERVRKALLARQQGQKQKELRLKKQKQLEELRLADRQRQRELEQERMLKIKAQTQLELISAKKDTTELERLAEKSRQERTEKDRIEAEQRVQLEKKRLEKEQLLQRALAAAEEQDKKEAELKAAHLKVCVAKHPTNETPLMNAVNKAEVANVVAATSSTMNSTFTMDPKPSTSTAAKICTSYEITPKRDPTKSIPNKNPDDYDIADIKENDSTDDESQPKKKIPTWAEGQALRNAAMKQRINLPDYAKIFPASELMRAPKLAVLFNGSKVRYFTRTSSANWSSPLFPDDSFVDHHRVNPSDSEYGQ